MLREKDFYIPNISNVPNSKEKLRHLIKKISYNKLTLADFKQISLSEEMGYSEETFRKVLNHSCIVGILDKEDNKYLLSKNSLLFLENKINFETYINNIILYNKEIEKCTEIIYTLIRIFPPSINMKTFYYIFSYISKERVDESALASTGRNLRTIFSLLKMQERIYKHRNKILLNEGSKNNKFLKIKSIGEFFQKDLININDITNYLNQYFIKQCSERILQCMTTYEYDNYIWSKSSLYKNNGEIRNLNGEFIMTVMIKRSEN